MMTKPNHRILLVDDDPDLLTMLSEWLVCMGYAVTTASSAAEAIRWNEQHDFQLIITDLMMPGFDGLQLLAVLKEIAPRTPVIFLTGEGTMDAAIAALSEGKAFAFLHKPIKDFHAFSQIMARAIALHSCEPTSPHVGDTSAASLDATERQILTLLCRGFDNRQIAERVVLSEKTVRNRISIIYDKLGVRNRVEAILCWQERGLT